uniref:Uncharacterized protein n=1 Tax=Chaetoceros debilis TaxID=122233 RepID=A0A7S3Q8A9_9STRA
MRLLSIAVPLPLLASHTMITTTAFTLQPPISKRTTSSSASSLLSSSSLSSSSYDENNDPLADLNLPDLSEYDDSNLPYGEGGGLYNDADLDDFAHMTNTNDASPPSPPPSPYGSERRKRPTGGGGGGGSGRGGSGGNVNVARKSDRYALEKYNSPTQPATTPYDDEYGNDDEYNDDDDLDIGEDYPLEYNVEHKWPWIHADISYSLPLEEEDVMEGDISCIVAHQCMNARGSIAHGKKIGLYLKNTIENTNSRNNNAMKATEVFDANGGYKKLTSTYAIKKELMTRGPVISTSFVQTSAFMNTIGGSHLLVPLEYRNRRRHPVLIVGWRHTSVGEVWLVKPFQFNGSSNSSQTNKPGRDTTGRNTNARGMDASSSDNELLSIACGQNRVDDECIAPTHSFEDMAWQDGPYLDFNLADAPQWRDWGAITVHLNSEELETLGEIFGDENLSLTEAVSTEFRFVLRDSTRIAHSKACYMQNVKRKRGSGTWDVNIGFTEEISHPVEVEVEESQEHENDFRGGGGGRSGGRRDPRANANMNGRAGAGDGDDVDGRMGGGGRGNRNGGGGDNMRSPPPASTRQNVNRNNSMNNNQRRRRDEW